MLEIFKRWEAIKKTTKFWTLSESLSQVKLRSLTVAIPVQCLCFPCLFTACKLVDQPVGRGQEMAEFLSLSGALAATRWRICRDWRTRSFHHPEQHLDGLCMIPSLEDSVCLFHLLKLSRIILVRPWFLYS